MGIIRFFISIIALLCVFCGCRDRNLAQSETLPSVNHVALQLRKDGGQKLNTVHICDEIEQEIMGITNMEIRLQRICKASDVLASMDFSMLSYADTAEAAYKYWHLFTRFFGLLSVSGISDEQRMSFLVRCLKKYKDVSFCISTAARMQDESDMDFSMRKKVVLQLYSEYVNNVRLWERFFRGAAHMAMKSIDERRLAKETAFLLEYPSKSDFLKKPIFTEPMHAREKEMGKSPVVFGKHPPEHSGKTSGQAIQDE